MQKNDLEEGGQTLPDMRNDTMLWHTGTHHLA